MFNNEDFLQLGDSASCSWGPCFSPGTPSGAIPGPSRNDFGMVDLWGDAEEDSDDKESQHLLLRSHEDLFASTNPWKDAAAQASSATMSWSGSAASGSGTVSGRYSTASSYHDVLKTGSQEVCCLQLAAVDSCREHTERARMPTSPRELILNPGTRLGMQETPSCHLEARYDLYWC